ncbi:dUTP diphosphatase [Mesoplasma photuris]|uniref:dUTP diphosphatase n=1 Tax=Mesoplasma photuris TaxID=217731 RepID=UPI0004E167CE|nr:dUTP diphosphatase [Mesoplasma photuris]
MLSKKTIIWLSEKQRILDNYIIDSKGFEVNDDILNKKIVAFIVELSEYANEERSFKFWANKPPSPLEIQLDEYIDGLHFLISIGIQIEYDFNNFKHTNFGLDNNIDIYLSLINLISEFIKDKNHENYEDVLNIYLAIAEVKYYSESEIVDAYKLKNKINFERQDNNY